MPKVSLISSVKKTVKNASLKSQDNSKKAKTQKLEKLPKKQNHFLRYAHRALKLLTKNKNLNFFPEKCKSNSEMNSSQTTSSSSSGSSKSGYNFRSSKDLGQDDFLQCKKSKSASRTIVSTTRSSSSPSPVFQIFPVKPKTLTRIPSIKMYPRKYSDRCLPCLYKTFTEPERSKCELPMTTLSSIVKEPFVEISESDTSSVSLRDLKISDFESLVFYERSNLESPSLPTQVILEKEDVNKTTEVSQDNESILSKDQSPLTKVTDTKKVSIRSGSIQSTDISKPSTPSGQSSESEDFRSEVISGALNTSKYLAPCHAPVVWKPSLDSLKALRSRKATSMQARASALIAKSDDDSELEDSMDESQNTRKRNKKPSCKTATIQSPDLKIKCDKEADSKSKAVDDDSDLRERRKKFVRTKTVTGEIDVFNTVESEKEKKFRFVRAQTYMNLTPNLDASREIPVNFNLKDSVENSITISEGSIGLKKESTEGKSLELTKEEQEFLDIFERCLEEGESPGMILIKWCDRYSELVLKARKGDTDPDSKRALKISLKLLKLLAESRRYLNADKLSPELEFSSEQPTSCNSRQLRRVLPLESYNLVASILKMPQWYPKKSVENNVINVKGRDLSKDSITRRRSSEFNLSLIVSIQIQGMEIFFIHFIYFFISLLLYIKNESPRHFLISGPSSI